MCCRGQVPTTSTTTTTSSTTSTTSTTATTPPSGITVTTTAGQQEEEVTLSIAVEAVEQVEEVEKVEVKEQVEETAIKEEEEDNSIEEPGEILKAEPSVVDEVIATDVVDIVDTELNLISTTTPKPTKFAPKFCLLLKFNCATRKTHVCCRYPLPGKTDGRRVILKQPKIQINSRTKPPTKSKQPTRRPKPVRKNFLSRTKTVKRTSTLAPISTTSLKTTTKTIAQRRNVVLPRICKRLVTISL
jgi:hypothetical protein